MQHALGVDVKTIRDTIREQCLPALQSGATALHSGKLSFHIIDLPNQVRTVRTVTPRRQGSAQVADRFSEAAE
jgi:hypothetical protein